LQNLAQNLESWRLSSWKAYALAICGTLFATFLRVALDPVLEDTAQFAFFVPVLVLVPMVVGLRPTIAMIFVTVLCAWFILLTDQTFADKLVTSGVLMLVCIFLCSIVLLARATLLREARANREARLAQAEADRHREAAEMLSGELNHRIKNLFAVIQSFVQLTGRRTDNPETKQMLADLREQIAALGRAHAIAQGTAGEVGQVVLLSEVLDSILKPYGGLNGEAGRISSEGIDLNVPVTALTPLGLIFHELATNASKYGALAHGNGLLAISWTTETGPLESTSSQHANAMISIDWFERGVTRSSAQEADGFGTRLVTNAARQLGGEVERSWTDEGMRVHLIFPQQVEAG
jgi:two-component sensor histidine kinase